MATKAKNNTKAQGQGVVFAPGTRHNGIAPSLATLTRQPIQDIAIAAMPAKTASGQRREFILALLTQAGAKGITWAQIRQDLIAGFGSAPKKRAALYGILAGQSWYKQTGEKGVVTYFLGRVPKRGKAK
jgi:hypothetical protein